MPDPFRIFERLEPCEGKLSRTVLRGAGPSNWVGLPAGEGYFGNDVLYGSYTHLGSYTEIITGSTLAIIFALFSRIVLFDVFLEEEQKL